MLACLDELLSTAPLPTLRTRTANERALGISIIYAAQTWRQFAALFGGSVQTHPHRRMITMSNEPLVQPFPMPTGERLRVAYWDLYLSDEGTDAQKERLGDVALLPRPWDIATCTDPDLRRDVWEWYEAVVTWFNHEYVWDPAAGMIPPCWPQHPHLVHDIGVLADQRRMIALANNSNSLEEWHRYSVPAFFDRLHERVKQHCDDHHQPWPARARFSRHLADVERRSIQYDSGSVATSAEPRLAEPVLRLVDRETGRPINPETGDVT
jgi:hypothetical protein